MTKDWFVSLDGNDSAKGTINDPLTVSAIVNKVVNPGDQIIFRDGEYDLGDQKNQVAWQGEIDRLINITPYRSERVIFDGNFTCIGEYQKWGNFEFLNTNWITRTSEQTGSAPTDIGSVYEGLILDADNLRVEFCLFHDCWQGISGFSQINTEIEGCLFWNNGWIAPDRGHGHGIYVHGENINIKNNIFAQGFSEWGLHAFGTNGKIKNLKAINNISINNIFLAQTVNNGLNNVVMQNNEIWKKRIEIGGNQWPNINIVVKDNYIGNGNLILRNCIDPVNEGNVLADSGGNRVQSFQMGERWAVAIFNWEGLSKVNADLYGIGLKSGFKYIARNAQNYFGDYFFFTYDETYFDGNQAIEFPMTDHSVAIPYLYDEALQESSFPDFGCFIIEEVGRDFHGRQEISPWTN